MTTTATLLPSSARGIWHLDAVHSRVSFAVGFVAGRFRASFADFEATLDTSDGTIRLAGRARPESVDVALPPFRGHLLGPEFFDTDSHPYLTFASQQCRLDGNAITMAAELVVRGIQQRGDGTGTLYGPIANQFGVTAIGIALEATVNRHAFGLDWQVRLPDGSPALADEVQLEADLQFTLPGNGKDADRHG